MARPALIVSADWAGPIDTQITSVALPASLRRNASSTAISSKGFIDIFTLASSTPVPSGLTRIFTLKSTTRFTGTRIFIRFDFPLQSSTRNRDRRYSTFVLFRSELFRAKAPQYR